MMEKLIHCPACNSENLENAVFCCQCSAPMRRGVPARIRKSQWISVVLLSLILSSMMTLGLQLIKSRHTSQASVEHQSQVVRDAAPVPSQATQAAVQPDRTDHPALSGQVVAKKKNAEEMASLVVGTVSIKNSDLGIMSEFPAAVIGGSWLALPSRKCVGGNKWFFRDGDGEAIPFEGGLWSDGDVVGFWRLAGEQRFEGPDFTVWQQDVPVRHLSIETGLFSEPMTLNPSEVRGAFIFSPLSIFLEPGVFLQNGKVVGWSFGDVLQGAYMWSRSRDTNLLYENYVDDFYNQTFAGGREEYFAIALSMDKNALPQSRLQKFIEGFRVQSKLSPQETPRYLAPETVYPYISELVSRLMEQGAYQDIASLADEPLLREVRTPELLMNVISSLQKSFGTERAVNFIEGQDSVLPRVKEGGKKELTRLHLELYLGWIKTLLDNGDTERGRQIYKRAQSRFNEAPELHLLGVELALADQDWAEAESLLDQREYPAALREKKMLLAGRIADLKGRENKIVISFHPGSREIQVNATVNDKFDHNFLVDTGASFVTIPYSFVKTLGLEDEMSGEQQEIQTAGGPVNAGAVTLASIELQGWVVSNVKAFVIDLPNRPGLGLLGLNFLNSFRVDLQADKGILMLEPK